jgi:hypothetical protein
MYHHESKLLRVGAKRRITEKTNNRKKERFELFCSSTVFVDGVRKKKKR